MLRSPLSRTYLTFNYLVGACGLSLLVALTLLRPAALTAGYPGFLPVTFLAVFIGARFFKIDIPPNITVSLVVPLQCAAIVLLGPWVTGWVAVAAYLSEAATAALRRELEVPPRLFWSIVAYNAGMESLMTVAGGIGYVACGGKIGPELFSLGQRIVAFLGLFLALKAVNEGLMAVSSWFRGRPLELYWRGARVVLVTESVTLPLGLLLVQIQTALLTESLLLFCGLFLGASLLVKRLDASRKALERSNTDLEKRNKELDALLEIGKAISSDIEIARLMETIHRSCSEILDTSYFYVALYHEETQTLVIEIEVIEGQRQPRKVLSFGEGLTSLVILTKQHLLVRDMDGERERIPVKPLFLNEYPTRSWLGVPMIAGGEAVGAIAIQNRNPNAFDEEDVRVLSSIASQAAIAVKNARLHQDALERILIEEENRQLLRLNQKKSEFVNMVAHEFQSPLTSVIGFSNLLMEPVREGMTVKEARRHLEMIHSEARRLSQMVEDLLNLSRIRSGRLSLTLQDFDVNSVVTETAGTFYPQVREKEQSVTTTFAAPQLHVHGDSNYVRQVLANLLSNAIKYSPRGASILVETSVQGRSALVTVRDTGPGIPPGRQERIFEEFYRSDDPEVRKSKGIGLGLAITRGIVEAHGGKIWCESAPGQGTAFHFTLPRARVPAAA